MLFGKVITSGRIVSSKLFAFHIRTMSVKSTFLQIDELGEPDKVLKLCEAQLNSPKDNEILVKMIAAPINPAIINIIQGMNVHEIKTHGNIKNFSFFFCLVLLNRKIW